QHEITDIDGLVYTFTVKAFEDVVHVMTAFFTTIFNDLKKAVEFLSKLFDWEQIKANHTLVKQMVTNAQQSVRSFLTSDSDALKTYLHNFFQGLENTITDYVNQTVTAIGGQSFGSNQQNGNDPKQLFGGNGSYAQSK